MMIPDMIPAMKDGPPPMVNIFHRDYAIACPRELGYAWHSSTLDELSLGGCGVAAGWVYLLNYEASQ